MPLLISGEDRRLFIRLDDESRARRRRRRAFALSLSSPNGKSAIDRFVLDPLCTSPRRAPRRRRSSPRGNETERAVLATASPFPRQSATGRARPSSEGLFWQNGSGKNSAVKPSVKNAKDVSAPPGIEPGSPR
eukprot:31418-Pelagococcus_subviridis.AAC.13